MIVLGIETSCDETAVAIVGSDGQIHAHELHSQIDEHALYGGVVPEIAARAHLERLDILIDRALKAAGFRLDQMDGIAATAGPGLIGGLMVGTVTAKAMASVVECPFIAVNHLEAHALTARLTDNVAFPYLLLLVSGGHAQILIVEDVGKYQRLGATIDDAVGETFDKVAKMLGLGMPGGPAVEVLARSGDPARFSLPRPMLDKPIMNFSFSGLKTAVRQLILKLDQDPIDRQTAADICASLQAAIADCLEDRLKRAISNFRETGSHGPIVVAGGVAANRVIGTRLRALATVSGLDLAIPPPALCTDNGVMVAWAGIERLQRGLVDGLDFKPRPRWPLDPDGPVLPGAGVKA